MKHHQNIIKTSSKHLSLSKSAQRHRCQAANMRSASSTTKRETLPGTQAHGTKATGTGSTSHGSLTQIKSKLPSRTSFPSTKSLSRPSSRLSIRSGLFLQVDHPADQFFLPSRIINMKYVQVGTWMCQNLPETSNFTK